MNLFNNDRFKMMQKIKNSLIYVLLSLISLSVYANQSNKTFETSKSLSIFNSLMRELDMYYVDTLDHQKLIQTAIDEMLRSLDPYTVYIPESDADDLSMMTSGEYGGIGAIITKTNEGVCISDPYEGMPAHKHGLKAGDLILEIDGEKTEGWSVSEVSSRLKGTPGTEIKLKIQRYGHKKAIQKKFLREKIQIPPISYYYEAAPKIGYVLLHDFTEHSALELKAVIQEMEKTHGIESLILDLRDNGGGLISEAVKIMGYFVEKGTEIVSTKGKGMQVDQVYKTTVDPVFPNMKVAVLVNGNSASASEIIAGAMQDLDRAVVVGERTFGKGLVQNIRPVTYNGHLKVTTAKYYIPSGRCIQAVEYDQKDQSKDKKRILDANTHEFKTRNGRIVKDGGGVIPDTITQEEPKITISYYLYTKNAYFDFATRYAHQHEKIANPQTFKLTDAEYQEFKEFIKERGITYTTVTKNKFDEMMQYAKLEGLDEEAKEELESLQQKLNPDIETGLDKHKDEIIKHLESEIIKRYYYQKGVIEYSFQYDEDLKTATNLLQDDVAFKSIIEGKK